MNLPKSSEISQGDAVLAAHALARDTLIVSQIILSLHASALAEHLYDQGDSVPVNTVIDLVLRAASVVVLDSSVAQAREMLDRIGVAEKSISASSVHQSLINSSPGLLQAVIESGLVPHEILDRSTASNLPYFTELAIAASKARKKGGWSAET